MQSLYMLMKLWVFGTMAACLSVLGEMIKSDTTGCFYDND